VSISVETDSSTLLIRQGDGVVVTLATIPA
jgi:hypothetical protein